MNEPYGWTFLCIWYDNSWFRVYEVKRLYISLYMAFCIPFHLRQRTSRVYQDHLHFFRVLTSFVPPVHNQGVSLAPLQGLCPMENIPADYRLILCFSVTDFCMIPIPAPFGRRFPGLFLMSPAFLLRLDSVLCRLRRKLNSAATGIFTFLLILTLIQPASVACGCHSSVSADHSPLPLLELRRTP